MPMSRYGFIGGHQAGWPRCDPPATRKGSGPPRSALVPVLSSSQEEDRKVSSGTVVERRSVGVFRLASVLRLDPLLSHQHERNSLGQGSLCISSLPSCLQG
jgi:hypothetical protein